MPESWLIGAAFVMAMAIGAVAIHLIEWHLYATARNERDQAREDLVAVTNDRDGWRSVAERALLVAQIGKQVTLRATRVAGEKRPIS